MEDRQVCFETDSFYAERNRMIWQTASGNQIPFLYCSILVGEMNRFSSSFAPGTPCSNCSKRVIIPVVPVSTLVFVVTALKSSRKPENISGISVTISVFK